MAEPVVQLRVEQMADVTIITVDSVRIGAEMGESFEEQVVLAVDRLELPKVLIDFTGVQFISSSMLGKLIKLNGRVVDRGGQLKLAGLHPKIAEVFRITNLDQLFSIHKNRDGAIKAFT